MTFYQVQPSLWNVEYLNMENTNCSENTQNQNTEDKWTEIPERPVYVGK